MNVAHSLIYKIVFWVGVSHTNRVKMENHPLLSRRDLLIGSAMLPTACATASRPVPGLVSEQISPDGPISLAGDEGVAVGVAIYGKHGRSLLGGELVSFAFEDAKGLRRELRCWPSPHDRAVVSTERGVELHLTAFAFKLPAGRSRIVGRPVKGEFRWELLRGPEMDFDVAAGRVTYIGRLGAVWQETEYPTREGRDAACRSGYPSALLASRFSCSEQDFVFGNEPERDVPLIRAAFPALATRSIEAGPAARPSSFWRPWPEAGRPRKADL